MPAGGVATSAAGLARSGARRQPDRVPETMESARRWSGYVCPDCRFVFRVPRDHDGAGVVCPSCRRMLRIPAADDVPPPLVAAAQEREPEAEEATAEGGHVRRKRHHGSSRRSTSPEWEHEGKHRTRRGEQRAMRWMLAGGIALFLSLVAAVIFALREREPLPVVAVPVADAPAEAGAEGAAEVPDLPEIMRRSEVDVLAEAEVLAREFLNASSTEEILPLVRDPQTVAQRIGRIHPDGRIEPRGLSQFNPSGAVGYRGAFASVDALDKDFAPLQIAFVQTPEGLKIDWESFVGWSDMPWEEFVENRPTEPHVFRVTLKQVDYYNFDFSDDTQWQSYSLASPDGEHVLYGYAERGSILDQRVKPDDAKQSIAVTLALRFPENPEGRGQVIIDDYIVEGWVTDDAPDP